MINSISKLLDRVVSKTTGYHSEAVWSLHETKPADGTVTHKQMIHHMISLILAVDVENKDRDIPDVYCLDQEVIDGLTKWISSINPEPEAIGTCSDCAGYFDAGKDNCKTCDFDLNSYNKPEETDDEDEDPEFTCDTCDCALDPNDLINGFHDQSVYQCADCFDNDQSEDEKEIDEDDDE